MEWFSGGVVNAISACRRDKVLFIVFMYDESSASNSTTEAWNSDEVLSLLSGKQAVAIKISKGSVEHQQFSQLWQCVIDPVFIFPSTFCIGLMGKALVIMNGQQSSLQIKEKLGEAFEKLRCELESTSPPPPPPPSPQVQPQTTPTQPETPPTQTQDNSNDDSILQQPVASSPSPGPTVEIATPSPSSEGSAQGGGGEGVDSVGEQASNEEKVTRTQEKIRQKRQEREETQFQRQKSEELKRRQEGKQLAESRKDLDDLHKRTWIQERKKAKEEERAAKEAIRAKLQQDRMERESLKRAREQQTPPELRHRSSPSSPAQSNSTPSMTSNNLCRLQLRLPSGGKSILQIKTDDSLGSLRERIAKEVGVAVGGVVLSSTYPLKELTGDMDEATMSDLGLAPSGVIVVRYNRRSLGAVNGVGGGGTVSSGLWGAIMYLFQLVLNLVSFVKRICGCGDDEIETVKHKESYLKGGSGGSERMQQFRPSEFDENSSDDDDEERRNTYNGNSTEQQ